MEPFIILGITIEPVSVIGALIIGTIIILTGIALYSVAKVYFSIRKWNFALHNFQHNTLDVAFEEGQQLSTVNKLIVVSQEDLGPVFQERYELLVGRFRVEANPDWTVLENINELVPLPDVPFANNVTGSLVLLGLLGTVTGLAVAISSMSDVNSTLSLMEGVGAKLNTILSGMGVAFRATAFGALATIILIFSTYVMRKSRERYDQALDKFFIRTIFPLYHQEKQDTSRNDHQLVTELQTLVKEIKFATEALTASSVTTSDQSKLMIQAANGFQMAAKSLKDHFEEPAKIYSQTVNVVEEMKRIAGKIEEHVENIHSINTLFSDDHGKIITRLNESITAMSNGQASVDTLSNTISGISEKLNESLISWNALSGSIDTNTNNLRSTVNTSIDNITGLQRSNNELLQEFVNGKASEASTNIQTLVNDYSQNISTLTKKTIETLLDNHNGSSQAVLDIKKSIESLDILKNLDGLPAHLDKITSAMEELNQKFGQFPPELRIIAEAMNAIASKAQPPITLDTTPIITALKPLLNSLENKKPRKKGFMGLFSAGDEK